MRPIVLAGQLIMKRRAFVAGFGAAVALRVVAQAQQPATPVIGVLNAISSVGRARELAAFRQGLNEGGYFEGRNVAIEYRSADGQYEQCRHWPPSWFVVR